MTVTAFIMLAGFKTGKTHSPLKERPVSEELKDNAPIRVNCISLIGDKIQVVAIATGCTKLDKAKCILTLCPEKKPKAGQKAVLVLCKTKEGTTVAAASSCTTAENAYCTPNSCPPGTEAGSQEEANL